MKNNKGFASLIIFLVLGLAIVSVALISVYSYSSKCRNFFLSTIKKSAYH